jgi:UDP-N-acetylglucosamine 3-dehydrogenase
VIRVGILGAGNIAGVHARAYAQMTNARVVAVDDIDCGKAEALATEHRARPYSDWASFFADQEIDMVDVCLPTYLHADAVIAAAAAGRHVLCEKPLALSLEQAGRMIAAVQQAGVQAMVAQVIRFWPHYLAIKAMLERGDLGRPIMANAHRLGSLPAWASWYAQPEQSGGAIMDLHIHDLDWLYYLFGKPSSVYAIGRMSANGSWNQVLTSLDYAHTRYGPTRAAAEATHCLPQGCPFTMIFRLLGEDGYAEYHYGGAQLDPAGAARQHSLVLYQAGQPPQYPACSDVDPYLAEIRYFVDCLASGQAPAIATLAEARDVLAIALAVRRSLQSGQVIQENDI